ncbi:asparagine synthase [Pseudomonas sp. Os17]|nr:asparagine synthase [Pseudomonas sp. Os17]
MLVFDGYLINRIELIDALALPREAHGWADSAIAFEAMARWGARGPERMLGDFALVVWNVADRSLLLARDAVGQRPLYYHQKDGLFAFATNPAALLAVPGIDRELNEEHFVALLSDLPVADNGTPYKHLRLLPAGSVAILRSGQLKQHFYWTPEQRTELRLPREEEYVEAARELFERAVKDCLRIEGPAFSSLTGGLDSSAVSVTAVKHLPGNSLTTITCLPAANTELLDSNQHYMSERRYVESICEQTPGLQPLFFNGPVQHRWDTDWLQMFQLTGVPWRNVMNLAWMGSARDHIRRQGGRVLLTGALGNVTLSWDGQGTLTGLMRDGRWLKAFQESLALARTSGQNAAIARQIWRSTLAPFAPEIIQQSIAKLQARSSASEWGHLYPIDPMIKARIRTEEGAKRRKQMASMASWQLRQAWFRERQSALQATGLVRALHGFEVRDPMADRRLLEFCFSLPDSLYLQGGVTRLLARRVTADRLPGEVVNNRKRGMQCPEYLHRMSMVRPFLGERLEELEASPLAQRLLDLKRMKALLSNWPNRPASPEHLIVLHRGLHFGAFLRWIETGRQFQG